MVLCVCACVVHKVPVCIGEKHNNESKIVRDAIDLKKRW